MWRGARCNHQRPPCFTCPRHGHCVFVRWIKSMANRSSIRTHRSVRGSLGCGFCNAGRLAGASRDKRHRVVRRIGSGSAFCHSLDWGRCEGLVLVPRLDFCVCRAGCEGRVSCRYLWPPRRNRSVPRLAAHQRPVCEPDSAVQVSRPSIARSAACASRTNLS